MEPTITRCHICDRTHSGSERCPHCYAYVINPLLQTIPIRKGMSRFPMPYPPAIPRRVGDSSDQYTARTINHGA